MRQYRFRIFIVILCLGLGGLSFDYTFAQEVSKPKPVRVVTPQRGKIEQRVTYTGNLEADAMVEIYANTPGKLVALEVNEGDHVKKSDVLARIDSRELHIALKQAQAASRAAKAQLLTVKATAQIKIETQAEAAQASLDAAKAQLKQAQTLAQAQVTSQFDQATASVTAAEANLEKTVKGARNQEIQQAKAAVSGEQAKLENAKSNFDRARKLHEKDAISDRDLDNAKAQLDGAKAQHEARVEQLSLVQEGVRKEDVTAAETQLSKAEAALELSRVSMETEDWNTQISIAESQVRQAESNLLTARNLVKIKAWENEITAAQAQFDQANEQVNLAKKRHDDATITSPINGIVANRNADLGDYLTGGPGGSPIFTIVKMDVVKVVFAAPEVDLGNLVVGTPISISTSQAQIDGNIDFISPIVNSDNRTVKIKAEISNPEYQLKPGMFAEVGIDLSAAENLLLLPREVVLDIKDRAGHVFVAKDGKARRQIVKVGLVWGEKISILEGVTDSTFVIVSGHRQLADGMKIVVVK